MKKTIFILALMLFAITQNVQSQNQGQWSFQYSMGFATGELAEYISQPSFRGGTIEYRKNINENLALGADLGWNVFYEKKENDTYSAGTVTLSGIQYRTQNTIPVLVSAEYSLGSESSFKPYVGLGIGTMYIERATDMGQWRLVDNPWTFAVKPEVGFRYALSLDTYFKLEARYYNGFKTDKLANQGYMSISAGLAINLR